MRATESATIPRPRATSRGPWTGESKRRVRRGAEDGRGARASAGSLAAPEAPEYLDAAVAVAVTCGAYEHVRPTAAHADVLREGTRPPARDEGEAAAAVARHEQPVGQRARELVARVGA